MLLQMKVKPPRVPPVTGATLTGYETFGPDPGLLQVASLQSSAWGVSAVSFADGSSPCRCQTLNETGVIAVRAADGAS